MKKAVNLIFTLFMFFSFAVSVNAEEFNGADLFTVNLPEGFEQQGSNATDFSFTNENGDIFAIGYYDNTQKDEIFSPADMSKKDIKEYTEFLSEESETVMKDFADDFELEILSGEKIKHKSGKTALVCKTRTTVSKDKRTETYYQTIYEFGGVNYKYTFTYTTSDEKNKDSLNDAFESINVFEGETRSNLDKLTGYALMGGIVLLIFIGIIKFIRTPEKRAQGKLK